MEVEPDTERGTAPGPGRSPWLLPALTLVAGVALGASVVAATSGGGDGERPTAQASPSGQPAEPVPTSTPGGSRDDLLVRVPASCLEAADRASEAAGQFDDVAEALGALDARRLQELVDRFQRLQPEIQRQADDCRLTAGVQQGGVTPTPG